MQRTFHLSNFVMGENDFSGWAFTNSYSNTFSSQVALDSTVHVVCPAWSSHFLATTLWLSQIMVSYCLFIIYLFRDENIHPRQGVTYDMLNCKVMEVYYPLLLRSGVGKIPYIRTSASEIQSNHNT